MSVEISVQSLMQKASNQLEFGSLQLSYESYIKALMLAVEEIQRLPLRYQYPVQNNLASLFDLAQACLKQAMSIYCSYFSSSSLEITTTTTTTTGQSRPLVPPKPSCLSTVSKSNFTSRKLPASVQPRIPRQQPSSPPSKLTDLRNVKRAKSKPDLFERQEGLNYNTITPLEKLSFLEYSSGGITQAKPIADHLHRQHNVATMNNVLNPIEARPKLLRRSSTSSLPNTSLSNVVSSTTINAVKQLFSISGTVNAASTAASASPSNQDVLSNVVGLTETASKLDKKDLVLLLKSTIDANNKVTTAQLQPANIKNSGQGSSYTPSIPKAPLSKARETLLQELKLYPSTHRRHNIQSALAFIQEAYLILNQIEHQSSKKASLNQQHLAQLPTTILQFHPAIIAYQLTRIDASIFQNIPVEALLTHTAKQPHPAIVASTDFFNYLTRLIECDILSPHSASGRATHINHWIKVANQCHDMRNYQTLKAIISALGTPPLQRLKRSWQFVPKRSLSLLEQLNELMSEANNHENYREELLRVKERRKQQQHQDFVIENNPQSILASANHTSSSSSYNEVMVPIVPFLGLFIHDMTYLSAASLVKPYDQHKCLNSTWSSSTTAAVKKDTGELTSIYKQDVRVAELLNSFQQLQKSSIYSTQLPPTYRKEVNKSRKRKLTHALTRPTVLLKIPTSSSDSVYLEGEENSHHDLAMDIQQCLVTQYLLSRPWVTERMVDLWSLRREPSPTKTAASPVKGSRNCSMGSEPSNSRLDNDDSNVCRTSTGSMNSSSTATTTESASSISRPVSLELSFQELKIVNKTVPASTTATTEYHRKPSISNFWLFGRKSADQGKGISTQELPNEAIRISSSRSSGTATSVSRMRYYSFDQQADSTIDTLDTFLNYSQCNNNNYNTSNRKQSKDVVKTASTAAVYHHSIEENVGSGGFSTLRMQREGSLPSIFRKDFWNRPTLPPSPPLSHQQQQRALSATNNLSRNNPTQKVLLKSAEESFLSTAMNNGALSSKIEIDDMNTALLSTPHPLDTTNTAYTFR